MRIWKVSTEIEKEKRKRKKKIVYVKPEPLQPHTPPRPRGDVVAKRTPPWKLLLYCSIPGAINAYSVFIIVVFFLK